jgi:hypothetical protein
MAKIEDLISIEKQLLEIEDKHKFDITLDELIELEEHTKKVGAITSIYFNVQFEFSRKFDDENKLQKYHDKLTECELTFDYDSILNFIATIKSKYGN